VSIEFIILRKNTNLKIDKIKFILKPVLASAFMGIIAYITYIYLATVISSKISTVIALGISVIVYFILIIILKIFSKEELYMLPFGKKLHFFFRKNKNILNSKNTVESRVLRNEKHKRLEKTGFERKNI